MSTITTNTTNTNLTTPARELTEAAYNENKPLTITQSAEVCSVSRDTIKRRIRENKFPNAWQQGQDRQWLIPVQDLVTAGLIERERVTLALGKMEEVRERRESAEANVQIAELSAENKGLQNQVRTLLDEVAFLRSLAISGRAA